MTTQKITLVGAGHYAKNLIGPKYLQNPSCSLKALISPHLSTKSLDHSPLQGQIICHSLNEWEKKFGPITKSDLFDLCLHPEQVLPVLETYARSGAKKFILPKAWAFTKKDTLYFETLVKKHHLHCEVASQWFYSTHLKTLKKPVSALKRVEMDFSQKFTGKRGKRYSVETALLPHMLQILFSLKLLSLNDIRNFQIQTYHQKDLILQGISENGIFFTLRSSLACETKTQTLKLFYKNEKTPVHLVDFVHEGAEEDVLATMNKRIISSFRTGRDSFSLPRISKTLEAQKIIHQKINTRVLVIGGGIFGVCSAMELAKKKIPVTLVEKKTLLLDEASTVNQCRVHRGYHYPRDPRTVLMTQEAQKIFEREFETAIVRQNFRNYYCLAKQGGFMDKKSYLGFCKRFRLPVKSAWPAQPTLNKKKIECSFLVPEKIFDVKKIRELCENRIEKLECLKIQRKTEVVKIRPLSEMYRVTLQRGTSQITEDFAGILNATYASINTIHQLAGLSQKKYQYELCEMPLIHVPWKEKTGLAVMDGPFFGLMPFGFRKDYLLYDVELSVLEKSVSKRPVFTKKIASYDTDKSRLARFKKYQKKIEPYLPQIMDAVSLGSIYTIRIVLPFHEKDDSRPTVILRPRRGFWSIFSGKITTSVTCSRNLASEISRELQHAR